jgi:thymidylate kinase
MSNDQNQDSTMPRSAFTLLEKLDALGIQVEAIFGPDESGRITIEISRSDRDRARATAISLGMKPLRIESRPSTHYDEVLVSERDDGRVLTTTRFRIGSRPASTPEEVRDAELSAGGICVAISGGDGAGKSTAISMLQDWLLPIFRVQLFHFGRPRPLFLSSLVYRSLGLLRRVGFDVPQPMVVSEGAGIIPGVFSRLALALQLLCLARDRRRTHIESRIAVGSGLIVLCDRYADSRISDMEGPRLQNLWPSPVGWQARLLEFERGCYQGFVKPDVHIILRVSPDVARRRQPADDPAALRRRVEAVARACEQAPDDVIVVDADAPMESVHKELRRIVWESL